MPESVQRPPSPPASPPPASHWHHSLVRLAWPLAFVGVAALGVSHLNRRLDDEPKASVIEEQPSHTVVQELRELARLQTLEMHLEKVVDVSDRQRHLFGAVTSRDSLLYVAAGEATLGVDLATIGPDDVSVDRAAGRVVLRLNEPEVFSVRLDEQHSYVHTRNTELLASRNEQLEATARRRAVDAFTRAAHEPAAQQRAREGAEKALRALAAAWQLGTLEVQWKRPFQDETAPSAPSAPPVTPERAAVESKSS